MTYFWMALSFLVYTAFGLWTVVLWLTPIVDLARYRWTLRIANVVSTVLSIAVFVEQANLL